MNDILKIIFYFNIIGELFLEVRKLFALQYLS